MEPKPCPFCGSVEIKTIGDDFWSMMCLKCGSEGPTVEWKSEALRRWNLRVGSVDPALGAACIEIMSRLEAAIIKAEGGRS